MNDLGIHTLETLWSSCLSESWGCFPWGPGLTADDKVAPGSKVSLASMFVTERESGQRM